MLELTEIIKTSWDNNANRIPVTTVPVLIVSPGHGSGAICKTIASNLAMEYFCIMMNQMVTKKDVADKIDPILEYAEEYPSRKVFIHLDELTRCCNKDIWKAVIWTIATRSYCLNEIPKNVHFVCTCDHRGAELFEAYDKQFISLIEYKTSMDAFVKEHDLHPAILNAIHNFNGNVFDDETVLDENPDEFVQICSPRTLLGLNKFLKKSNNKLTNDLCRQVVEGFIGWSPFASLIWFELTK